MNNGVDGPDFIGIGSQRCGSTFLRESLDAYPTLSMHPEEANFFNRRILTKGPDWYLQFFRETDAEQSGEISPNYAVMRPREIELAHDLFPSLSIILIVRHPVKRMWSALRRRWTYSYLENVEDVGEDVSSMLNYADQRLHDAFGDYEKIYTNWTSVFGENNVLLLRFDQLKSSSAETLARVLRFIGVDPDLDWIQSYLDASSIPNRSKAVVEMPPFVRYYLCRRYLHRTRSFNAKTEGLVQDWVDDMEQCVEAGEQRWEAAYQFRSALRYYPVQGIHRIVDPMRTWWKVRRAYQRIDTSEPFNTATKA
jgi:hypothetical protein